MTVAELIADLRKAPQDALVTVHTGTLHGGCAEVEDPPGWAISRARRLGDGLYVLDDKGTVDVVIL